MRRKQEIEWIRDPHGLAAYINAADNKVWPARYSGRTQSFQKLLGYVKYGYTTAHGVGYTVNTTDWQATDIAVSSEADGKRIIEAMYALED